MDTNVMYDPLSREGLVCVNGRCISNKRKFQVHDEKHIGLRSGNRRGNGQGGGVGGRRRKRRPGASKNPRHNGIPMNPYENLNSIEEEDELYEDDYGDEYDDEDDDLIPFEQ